MLYLASKSPRRSELLNQIGVPHLQLDVDIDETPQLGESPAAYVVRLALEKAQAGCAALSGQADCPVLGADTAVVIDNKTLGKPQDRKNAMQMLATLSGRTHKVFSGVALVGARTDTRLSVTEVTFRHIESAEAEAYWATGEPADKAGGYAVQGLGAVFIRELRGNYSGVMGLPLYETAELLGNEGIVLPLI